MRKNSLLMFIPKWAAAFVLVLTGGLQCFVPAKYAPKENDKALEVIFEWQQLLLEIAQASEGYRPPVSARMFAYVGLSAWESGRPSIPGAISLEKKLAGLRLPERPVGQSLVVAAALNATYATMTRHFFPHAPREVQHRYRNLAEKYRQILLENHPLSAVELSEKWGRSTADSIFLWSTTDSIGHEAYLYNFDRNYRLSPEPGQWATSMTHPMPPLLPYWGNSRTFFVATNQCPNQDPVAFSQNAGSDFFAQAMEVYSVSMPMSEEKRWIAEFWSDDAPGVSICAATRWISITIQALQKHEPNLPLTLETLLKTGLALNDVCVKIWQEKYLYGLERPDTYIRRHIAPNWEPLHESPPFPAYPSGHAGFAGAVAAVLERQLGHFFQLTDRTHEGRKEFLGKPRHFNSFQEMARESAVSRLYLGVHYRMDAEEGLRVGKFIGEKIAEFPLYNRELSAR